MATASNVQPICGRAELDQQNIEDKQEHYRQH